MKAVHLKCPNCGAELKLDMKHKVGHCYFCNSDFYLQQDAEKEIRVSNIKPETFKNVHKNKKNLFSNQKNAMIYIGVIVGFIALACIASMFGGDRSAERTEGLSASDSESTSNNTSTEISGDTQMPVEDVRTEPQSALMKQILSLIFEKDYTSITQSDRESICYLKVDKHLDMDISDFVTQVDYSFADYKKYDSEDEFLKKVHSITILPDQLDDSLLDVEDCIFLPNLTRLELPGSRVDKVDLSSLTQLSYLSLHTNIETLLTICNPQQITTLVLGYSVGNLEGLDQFPNLQTLIMDDCQIQGDLAELTELPNLKELYLHGLDDLKDVKVLSQLNQLTTLVLDLENMKDLSFLSGMKELEHFELLDGEVLDYEDLRGCKKLKNLKLDYMKQVSDLSPIASLEELEQLSVKLYDCKGVQEFSKLKNLRELTVSTNADTSLDFIRGMKKLDTLTLNNCYITDNFNFLSGMDGLKNLSIHSAMNVQGFDGITKQNHLKKLDLSNNQYYCSINGILHMKKLKVLNLNQCTFEADLSNLSHMESLKELYLDKVIVCNHIDVYSDGFYTSADYDQLKLNDLTSEIGKCKNLQILSLADNELKSVKFLKGMDSLQEVNLKNNYIKDFDVLKSLKKLKRVYIQNNLGEVPELENVVVYKDSGHIE